MRNLFVRAQTIDKVWFIIKITDAFIGTMAFVHLGQRWMFLSFRIKAQWSNIMANNTTNNKDDRNAAPAGGNQTDDSLSDFATAVVPPVVKKVADSDDSGQEITKVPQSPAIHGASSVFMRNGRGRRSSSIF